MQFSIKLRSLLDNPFIYRLFTRLLPGVRSARSRFVEQYVKMSAGDRVLDIGCGTGDILIHLPRCEYVGFDMNQDYIAQAKRLYGNRGTFICKKVGKDCVENGSYFDVVLAIGILHHLDDSEAKELFEMSGDVLRPKGKLVTLDNVLYDGQPWIERYIMSKDRGRYIRKREEYLALASNVFPNVQDSVLHDLLGMPYSHIILTCSK
jgi:SAM-dependent methyltransferase